MDQVESMPPPIRQFVPQATPHLDQLFWRALAKDPAQRFGSAIEMGDAFRAAFGLPATPQWIAQGDFASAARQGSPQESGHAQKLATLREIVAAGYRTQPLVARPHP
jgi:serine/threonine-protein kinase